jgi:4-carboxymuconolactone decarboxylase
MRTSWMRLLFSIFSVTCSFAAETGFADVKGAQALDANEQAIIPIAALTASGDIERLKPALVAGLDAGLTVNEIKEVLIQLYAYCGFPRSLNGINAFMEVMQVREAEGIKDNVGKEASPLPKEMDKDAYGAKVRRELAGVSEEPPARGYQLFTPVIDTYLKEHLFADIFARDVLDRRERELATISALAAMHGTEGQLRFHLGAAMNSGLTAAQLQAFVAVLAEKVGRREAEVAEQMLTTVLKSRNGG